MPETDAALKSEAGIAAISGGAGVAVFDHTLLLTL
jgi:hypothetical protein